LKIDLTKDAATHIANRISVPGHKHFERFRRFGKRHSSANLQSAILNLK
jgi:hypothetical protein